jgi:dihydrolipoamide dehydrogenase
MAVMSQQFDVIVLGGGPAGRQVAASLAPEGRSVALVHTGRPWDPGLSAKALLHSARRGETWETAVARRTALVARAADPPAGVENLAGSGRVTGPGTIEVDGTEYAGTDLVVCTGSEPVLPGVEGLADLPVQTGVEALRSPDLPRRLVVLGGGREGCELAWIYASFGSHVVLVEPDGRLPAGEAPFAADLLADALRRLGVEVRLGTELDLAERTGTAPRLKLSDGAVIDTDRILLCGPREPRMPEGLEEGLEIDEHCRVTERVWAAGDVTGLAPSAELAAYQARLVAAGLLGGPPRTAAYRAVPRVLCITPSIYAVGLTPASDAELLTAGVDLAATARAAVADDPGGRVELYADPARGVLAGAVAAGPYAEEWMGEIALAVRAEIPLSVLADVVHTFPTYGEAMEAPLRELAARL